MTEDYLACTIEEQTYALPLQRVDTVLCAAALCPPLKDETSSFDTALLGLLNYHGQLIAIKDGRKQFGHPSKDLQPSDLFILLRVIHEEDNNPSTLIGLRVDKVGGVLHLSQEQLNKLCPCYGFKGALPDGTLLVDLEQVCLVPGQIKR